MPLYDFRCAPCTTEFEAFAAPGATAPCPSCGSEEVQRRWTSPAVPRGPWLRGAAARRSDERRRVREELRREKRAR